MRYKQNSQNSVKTNKMYLANGLW